MANNPYMAGGKLFFKRKGASTYEELAAIEDAKINTKVEYAEVFDHSGSTKVLSQRIPKKFDATLSFKTTDISVKNLAMLIYGTATVIALHDDVEAEWSDVSVTKISAAKDMLLEGAFKFVSENAVGKEIVLEVFNAAVSANGDFNLQSEEAASISFEGAVLKNSSGDYFDWYVRN